MVQAPGLTDRAPPERTGDVGARRQAAPSRATAPRWPLVLRGAGVAAVHRLHRYPLVSALQHSLFEWSGTARGAFTGSDNFTTLVTHYPLNHEVWRAFLHNGVFFVGTMLIQNTAGLAFAVWLQKRRGKRFLQTAFTMPYLVSPPVVGYLWSLIQLVPLWDDFFFPWCCCVRRRKPHRHRAHAVLPASPRPTEPCCSRPLVATLPLVLLFLVATRQIIAGLTAGMGR